MLFCYPASAIEENWLHDSIVAILTRELTQEAETSAQQRLQAFPVDKRVEIAGKRAFLSKIAKFAQEARNLSNAEKYGVLECLSSQNQIPELFSGAAPIAPLPDGLRPEFIAATKELFNAAFKLLTALGVRDRQYHKVYEGIPARVCAFCGIEPLNSPEPEMPRESLDHYLALSLFPFAGVNLRNLSPMGHKCNSSHKLAKNILLAEGGDRRKCFDPYGDRVAKVILLNSRPFEGPVKDLFVLPDWRIDFENEQEETSTWDEVFDIRGRYRANILDAEMRDWIDHFAQWWSGQVAEPPTDAHGVTGLLQNYVDLVIQEGFSNSTFLRRATFEMLIHQCLQPASGARLVDWFISLLSPTTGAVLPPEHRVMAAI